MSGGRPLSLRKIGNGVNMWTKKATAIVSLSVILTIMGLATRNLLVMMLALTAIVFTIVSLFANTTTRLTADREMSQEKIFEDGSLKVELRILNQGGKTGFLEVRDKLPRTIRRRGPITPTST
jgi:uncharacterized protein (DUF58 family)